ncbi:MFS transporter [Microbacterium azadirachtae]|uniref:Putative transport protein HsrA n=1 Tax=Microbacterium azadirachtae TaxID=582680 RepID=A0A0F0LLH1_9MICO|nr:MFS transporter [Microbacterium azadirachtae]KJL34067.1 putative transport protein HsrA [Microbacterium azadirachtae]
MPSAPIGGPAPAGRFDRRLLAPMMVGSILNPINTAIIAVALTPIGLALGAPARETVWLVSSLYLATAIGQPLVGRLVDIFGVRSLFLLGAVLVTAAGAIGLFAPENRDSIWWLVAARVILGLGTCAGYPAAMHMIRAEGDRTGLASPAGILTLLSVTTQTIAVIAPALGGVLVGAWGWRATFAVNVPLGLATLLLGALFLPRRTGLEPEVEDRPRIDGIGILLFAVTMLTLLVFLQNIAPALIWLLVVALAAGVVFVWWERRIPDPFIDVRVLSGNRPLLLSYVRSLLTATISYTFVYGFTQWLEDGRGLSPTIAGLVLLPVFAAGIAVALAFGRRPEVVGKLLVGSAAQLVAGILVLFMTGSSPIWFLVLAMLVLGIPQGLNNLAIQNSLYFQAEPARIASSAGLLRTFFYLGAIVSSVIYGNVYGARATTEGLHVLGWVVVGIAAMFLLITVFDRSLARIGREDPPAKD